MAIPVEAALSILMDRYKLRGLSFRDLENVRPESLADKFSRCPEVIQRVLSLIFLRQQAGLGSEVRTADQLQLRLTQLGEWSGLHPRTGESTPATLTEFERTRIVDMHQFAARVTEEYLVAAIPSLKSISDADIKRLAEEVDAWGRRIPLALLSPLTHAPTGAPAPEKHGGLLGPQPEPEWDADECDPSSELEWNADECGAWP